MSAKILRFPDGRPEPAKPRRLRLSVSVADYLRDAWSAEPAPRPQLVRDLPVRRDTPAALRTEPNRFAPADSGAPEEPPVAPE